MYWGNKKATASGPSMETVVVLITLIIVLIIAVPLQVNIKEKSDEATKISICKTTVASRARGMILGHDSIADAECPLIEKDSKATNKIDVLEELTTQMYTCWDKFGRGELDFYSDLTETGGKIYCHPCSRITYSQNAKSPTFGEFGNYINTKKIPNSEQTFAEFFNSVPSASINLYKGGKEQDALMDLSKPIYTVFTVVKLDKEDLEEAESERQERINEFGIVPGAPINIAGDDLIGSEAEHLGDVAIESTIVVGSVKLASITAGAIATKMGAGAAAVLGGPVVWTILIAGAVAGGAYYYDAETDAELLVPSLAVYSADEIATVCDSYNIYVT